jgi:FkbM family methyltransferase
MSKSGSPSLPHADSHCKEMSGAFGMKLLKDLRHHLFYRAITRPIPGLLTLGQECPWTIFPKGLGPDSHVLCAGAGHDISFELELWKKFSCPVYLMDPSPTGKKTWTDCRHFTEGIIFLPFALSERDGDISLGKPLDPVEGSYRALPENDPLHLRVPARGITSLLMEWGWAHIDLIKLDIEGGEFCVLDALLNSKIPVRQICVELHHGKGFTTQGKDSVRMILQLLSHGFRLVHRLHWDHTFVHKSIL